MSRTGEHHSIQGKEKSETAYYDHRSSTEARLDHHATSPALDAAIKQAQPHAQREPEHSSENACTQQPSARLPTRPHIGRLTEQAEARRAEVAALLQTHHLRVVRREQRRDDLARRRVLVAVHARPAWRHRRRGREGRGRGHAHRRGRVRRGLLVAGELVAGEERRGRPSERERLVDEVRARGARVRARRGVVGRRLVGVLRVRETVRPPS
jgi:hypothetical protein